MTTSPRRGVGTTKVRELQPSDSNVPNQTGHRHVFSRHVQIISNIPTAGHIRLILVGCAPSVDNASTYPIFKFFWQCR
jgi:hypothetical protein